MGEAVFYLLWYSFLIYMVPFRWWENKLGSKMQTLVQEESDLQTLKEIKDIRKAVFRANIFLMGLGKCFAISLSIKNILKKTNIESTLFLGVCKSDFRSINAHAWLTHQGLIIYGGQNSSSNFRKLVSFS
jgi:uncharacterized membrane protein